MVSAKQRIRGPLYAKSKSTPLPSKLVKVLSTPMSDIRLDGVDHATNCNEKRERCQQCLDVNTCVVNTIPGFVSIKIETVSKFVMDIRRTLHTAQKMKFSVSSVNVTKSAVHIY